jgi:hypothetical protein
MHHRDQRGMASDMSPHYPDQWLASITNPTFLIEVVECAPDGNVAVIADGTRFNTSERYLQNNYRPLGDSA